ncbi:MAG: adenosylcobinamide amidohydrolase, partial [Desulfomonilaceae bacterium]
GTDQIFVAARMGSGIPLTGAGKHTKLGEMVAHSSLNAIKNTLIWQNSLTPNVQCSCMNQLGHTNFDESLFCDSVCSLLNESLSDVFRKNFISINLDPLTVASLSALKLVRQKTLWGVLPQGCIKDTFCSQAAQIACSVSGKYTKFDFFRRELSVKDLDLSETSFMNLVYRTFALGFSEKWK